MGWIGAPRGEQGIIVKFRLYQQTRILYTLGAAWSRLYIVYPDRSYDRYLFAPFFFFYFILSCLHFAIERSRLCIRDHSREHTIANFLISISYIIFRVVFLLSLVRFNSLFFAFSISVHSSAFYLHPRYHAQPHGLDTLYTVVFFVSILQLLIWSSNFCLFLLDRRLHNSVSYWVIFSFAK